MAGSAPEELNTPVISASDVGYSAAENWVRTLNVEVFLKKTAIAYSLPSGLDECRRMTNRGNKKCLQTPARYPLIFVKA